MTPIAFSSYKRASYYSERFFGEGSVGDAADHVRATFVRYVRRRGPMPVNVAYEALVRLCMRRAVLTWGGRDRSVLDCARSSFREALEAVGAGLWEVWLRSKPDQRDSTFFLTSAEIIDYGERMQTSLRLEVRAGLPPLQLKRRAFALVPAELLGEPTALYRQYDAQGRLLYIGISKAPGARTSGHLTSAPWNQLIARIEVQWFRSRGAALDAERCAIQQERPRFNVDHHPKPMHPSQRDRYLRSRVKRSPLRFGEQQRLTGTT